MCIIYSCTTLLTMSLSFWSVQEASCVSEGGDFYLTFLQDTASTIASCRLRIGSLFCVDRLHGCPSEFAINANKFKLLLKKEDESWFHFFQMSQKSGYDCLVQHCVCADRKWLWSLLSRGKCLWLHRPSNWTLGPGWRPDGRLLWTRTRSCELLANPSICTWHSFYWTCCFRSEGLAVWSRLLRSPLWFTQGCCSRRWINTFSLCDTAKLDPIWQLPGCPQHPLLLSIGRKQWKCKLRRAWTQTT